MSERGQRNDDINILVISDMDELRTRMDQYLPQITDEMSESRIHYANVESLENAAKCLMHDSPPYSGVIIDLDAVDELQLTELLDKLKQMPRSDMPIMIYSQNERTVGLQHRSENNLFAYEVGGQQPSASAPGDAARLLQSFGKEVSEFSKKAPDEKEANNFAVAGLLREQKQKTSIIVVDDDSNQQAVTKVTLNKSMPDTEVLQYFSYAEAMEDISKDALNCIGVIADHDTKESGYSGAQFCQDFDGIVPIILNSGSEQKSAAEGLNTTRYRDKAKMNLQDTMALYTEHFGSGEIADSKALQARASEVNTRLNSPQATPYSEIIGGSDLGVISASRAVALG